MVNPQPRRTLPRSARILSGRAFAQGFRRGARASDPFLTVYATPNGLEGARLGLSVGRRFGKAVRRNRIKRLIREAFRHVRGDLPQGMDYIVIPRPGVEAGQVQLRRSLRDLARRACRKLPVERRPGSARPGW